MMTGIERAARAQRNRGKAKFIGGKVTKKGGLLWPDVSNGIANILIPSTF
jgi:hypothetical protein